MEVILVDTNILLYAVDENSTWHARARPWLEERLGGPMGVGLPWPVLTGFVRIISNPRIFPNPMPSEAAWRRVEDWLALRSTFTPEPTHRHREIMSRMMRTVHRPELVPDAHLAALAVEYGLVLCSADADFGRFEGLSWSNPLAADQP